MLKEQDELKVIYPDLLLEGAESTVTLDLNRVLREVVFSQTNSDGSVTVIDKPAPVPGATPDATLEAAFGGEYTAEATVRLIPEGLSVVAHPPEFQSLAEKSVRWEWRLKPVEGAGGTASFVLEMDVVWKPKSPGALSPITRRNVWRTREPLRMPVGSHLPMLFFTFGSPLAALGGVATLAAGALRKQRPEEGDGAEPDAPPPPVVPLEEMMAGADAPDDAAEAAALDEVSGTVYAPSQAAPGGSFLVQVFAHLPGAADTLDELAKEVDEDAKRRGMPQALDRKIRRGSELVFCLAMRGLEIDDPTQRLVWRGETDSVQFGVTVPESFKPGTVVGTVTVAYESVPIGHLKFTVKVGAAPVADAAAKEDAPAGKLVRYKHAFISYASRDRQEVLKRVQMLRLAKIEFFQDLLDLEPGEEWEPLLYQYIDKSDVFYLFWSSAALNSEWVKKEVLHALERKVSGEGEPEIVPVIIEGPPPVKPWPELSTLHFNDKFIYFINSREFDS